MKGSKKTKNTLNLNLAAIWWKLFEQAVKLLEKKIKVVSDKTVSSDVAFMYGRITKEEKIIGFESNIFTETEGDLAYVRIAGAEHMSRSVIIVIGRVSPGKRREAIALGGYTKEAAVFFEKGGNRSNYETLKNVLWVNLEAFPSERFTKQCADWIFKGIPSHHMRKKKSSAVKKV